jgi:hypothetical protein
MRIGLSSSESPLRVMASTIQPAEVSEYASLLHDYAASTLGPEALHAWIVWRLILDCGLEHSEATHVTDAVFTTASLDPAPRTVAQVRRRRIFRVSRQGFWALGSFRHRIAH